MPITVSQVGSDMPTTRNATVSSMDGTKEWQPTLTLDEDGLLHQLRARLVQAIDASTCKLFNLFFNYDHISLKNFLNGCDNVLMWFFSSYAAKPQFSLQQTPPQNALVPLMQECLDAITEHQRLHALMKGELIKGLLPQSSIRAEYTVQRIRGT